MASKVALVTAAGSGMGAAIARYVNRFAIMLAVMPKRHDAFAWAKPVPS
jgi:NADP-dependent 3-hydroxy acid dehydrogenase YdfG